MSQNELLTNIQNLNDQILQGKALEAFENYYDDEVVMQENEFSPTKGKALKRQREIDFFNSLTEFRGAKVLSVAQPGTKHLSNGIWITLIKIGESGSFIRSRCKPGKMEKLLLKNFIMEWGNYEFP